MARKLLHFALFAGLACAAVPCCITYDKVKIDLTQETAAIIWDEVNKIEHFVRSAVFQGNGPNVGFVLPVPSPPVAIEEATETIFEKLEELRPEPILTKAAEGADTLDAAGTPEVEILEVKQVGDYAVTVLVASNGEAMAGWLKANGHKMRPAMTPWLEHYAQKKWTFVAFKFNGNADQFKTKALRVSFKTETPFYPYKMPSDTWPPKHYRPLSLYFLSTKPVVGRHMSGKAWPTSAHWYAECPEEKLTPIRDCVKGEAQPELSGNWILSSFQNSTQATDYSTDLTFVTAQNVEVEPSGKYEIGGGRPNSKSTSMVLVAIGALAGAGMAFLLKRKFRKPS